MSNTCVYGSSLINDCTVDETEVSLLDRRKRVTLTGDMYSTHFSGVQRLFTMVTPKMAERQGRGGNYIITGH
jgi:hypothetical protein